jgi:hypothetical protein
MAVKACGGGHSEPDKNRRCPTSMSASLHLLVESLGVSHYDNAPGRMNLCDATTLGNDGSLARIPVSAISKKQSSTLALAIKMLQYSSSSISVSHDS